MHVHFKVLDKRVERYRGLRQAAVKARLLRRRPRGLENISLKLHLRLCSGLLEIGKSVSSIHKHTFFYKHLRVYLIYLISNILTGRNSTE